MIIIVKRSRRPEPVAWPRWMPNGTWLNWKVSCLQAGTCPGTVYICVMSGQVLAYLIALPHTHYPMNDSKCSDRVRDEVHPTRAAEESTGKVGRCCTRQLSGPGWLQSAITLGGGSLAGALFLGVLGGTSLMWLQLVAIIMGVIMLSAISYVTLSTGGRPFRGDQRRNQPCARSGDG